MAFLPLQQLTSIRRIPLACALGRVQWGLDSDCDLKDQCLFFSYYHLSLWGSVILVYMGIKYYFGGILPTWNFSGQIFGACSAARGLFWYLAHCWQVSIFLSQPVAAAHHFVVLILFNLAPPLFFFKDNDHNRSLNVSQSPFHSSIHLSGLAWLFLGSPFYKWEEGDSAKIDFSNLDRSLELPGGLCKT